MVLVDAAAVAAGAPAPADPAAARACGLLAALTADAALSVFAQAHGES